MGCRILTPVETDKMFFPGSGGKPTKARAFCEQVKCPVQKECLLSAIANDLDGFWCGTTKDERRVMRDKFVDIVPVSATEFIEDVVPELKRRKSGMRRVYRKVNFDFVDTLVHLDGLTNPLDA